MSVMIKILKNKSGSTLNMLGQIVQNDEELIVGPLKFAKLADITSGLHDLISSGDVIVNNGNQDLSPTDGLEWAKILAPKTTLILKKSDILILCHNGSGQDVWLGFGDKLVPTDSSPWSPPYNCRVTQVQFTNAKNGTSNTKTINEIRCHYIDYSLDREIDTDDEMAWYVNNYENESIIRESGYGRTWEYNNSSEEDYMYKNKKYAFRMKNLQGTNPNDMIVTLLIEEI